MVLKLNVTPPEKNPSYGVGVKDAVNSSTGLYSLIMSSITDSMTMATTTSGRSVAST